MSDLDDLANVVASRSKPRTYRVGDLELIETTRPAKKVFLEWMRAPCDRCGRLLSPIRIRGYCRRCKREMRAAKQKRADDLILLEAQRKRATIERSAAGYEQMGWIRIGDHFIDPMTIRAVEPFESSGIFRDPIYGWNIFFFHGRPMHISFGSPSDAAAWLRFLGARAPHVRVIHREVQVFWWVSF